jgi:hypothetical protein
LNKRKFFSRWLNIQNRYVRQIFAWVWSTYWQGCRFGGFAAGSASGSGWWFRARDNWNRFDWLHHVLFRSCYLPLKAADFWWLQRQKYSQFNANRRQHYILGAMPGIDFPEFYIGLISSHHGPWLMTFPQRLF